MKKISKSSYIRGLKCPKSLYLHICQPNDRDEAEPGFQTRMDTGHEVGGLARHLFPGGIDASRGEPGRVAEALHYTRELIDAGSEVIYEATFSDGETLCYIDILVKEDGVWNAYEVKATTGVKEYHCLDAAFQYYVITRAGLPLQSISVIHLNNAYVRHGDLDLQALFTIEPVTGIIRDIQQQIPGQVEMFRCMLESGIMPEMQMGPQCKKFYDCDFLEYCQTSNPPNPASSILHPASRDQAALDEFKSNLGYPLFFMDFETIMPAIPLHNESRPYQQIPFQYSVHVLDGRRQTADDNLLTKTTPHHHATTSLQRQPTSASHHDYLGTPPADPRPAFIESLLDILGTQGSILVWNQTFEMGRLRELARDFPIHRDRIDAVLERIVDLMVPFRKKHLYVPEMNGSYSLKAVLPALIPDLSYNDLNIREGGTATMTYESLYYDPDPASVEKKRNDLLAYCELDTLSMVRILEKMHKT